MKVSELAAEMNDRFKPFDERFAQVDERFAQIDRRFAQIDERFNQVDKQFVELRQQIAAEGEKTRRHIDIGFERMKAERNLALDVTKATDERHTLASKHSCRITRID